MKNIITENLPYKVKDIQLAEAGRKSISISEKEMPGLMSAKKNIVLKNPLQD